jgi:hypothetical protein
MTKESLDTKAIREALASATSGPWDDYDLIELISLENEYGPYNAHLIANAPTWLQQLLDELEDYEDLKRQFAGLEYANIDNLKELEQLRDENERLKNLDDENETLMQKLVEAHTLRGKTMIENQQLQSDKAIAVNTLIKLRNTTPYGLYHEIIDAALEQIEGGKKE